jgi:hypothetical protein
MTTYESHLFNELLDVNYELETGKHNSVVMVALLNRYSQLVASLEDSMGEGAWKAFVRTGKEMFSAN